MKYIYTILLILTAVLSSCTPHKADTPVSLSENTMHIESSAFAHEGTIPTKYTCDGENIAPPLLISGIPENTKSLAIIMEDPDVPTSLRADGLFVHWVVWDIPPDTTDIPENAQSIGTVGLNTREQNAYT